MDQTQEITGLSVSVVSKSTLWKSRQLIQYSAMLDYLKKDFHGLADFYQQMSIYSSSNPVQLSGPWSAIQGIVPVNAKIAAKMFYDKILGSVGNIFLSMVEFGKVFASSPLSNTSNTPIDTSVGDIAKSLTPAASIISTALPTIKAPLPSTPKI